MAVRTLVLHSASSGPYRHGYLQANVLVPLVESGHDGLTAPTITNDPRAESITAAGGSGGVKAARPGAGAFRRRRLAGPDLGARHHPSLMAPAPEDASSPSSATLTDRYWG
jgi:hypothetical protein